jgi:hypothetical protein
MGNIYLLDIIDHREILIPKKNSIIVGRGIGCDYRTLVRFNQISLEQFSIRHTDAGDLFLTNLDTQVSIYGGTGEEPFGRELTNMERVFLGEYLTVNQDYQFRILPEKEFLRMRSEGVPGRT